MTANDINATGGSGMSALMWAAHHEDLELMDWLIEREQISICNHMNSIHCLDVCHGAIPIQEHGVPDSMEELERRRELEEIERKAREEEEREAAAGSKEGEEDGSEEESEEDGDKKELTPEEVEAARKKEEKRGKRPSARRTGPSPRQRVVKTLKEATRRISRHVEAGYDEQTRYQNGGI